MNSHNVFPKTALILGGNLNPERREDALMGRKPRVDAMEMESLFPALLFDYAWMEQRAKKEFGTRILLAIAKRFGHWSEILALRVIWDAHQFEAIYATGEDVGLPLAVMLRVFNLKRLYFVLRTEQPVFGRTQFRRNLYKRLMQFSINRVDVILTRTQAHVNYYKNNFHLGKTKVHFIPETTDTAFFNSTTEAQNFVRLNYLSKPYIVSAGLEMRDYDTLIAAARGLPVNVVICAGSPWAKVRFNPADKDFPQNVMVDSFSQLEMREIYRTAEFVVLPMKPTMRACGMNVILEAWAMRKAVIASRTEGLTSYIQENIDGLFVGSEDAQELRNSIIHLLNSPEEANRLGENGYLRISTELFIENYIETIRKTISQAFHA